MSHVPEDDGKPAEPTIKGDIEVKIFHVKTYEKKVVESKSKSRKKGKLPSVLTKMGTISARAKAGLAKEALTQVHTLTIMIWFLWKKSVCIDLYCILPHFVLQKWDFIAYVEY